MLIFSTLSLNRQEILPCKYSLKSFLNIVTRQLRFCLNKATKSVSSSNKFPTKFHCPLPPICRNSNGDNACRRRLSYTILNNLHKFFVSVWHGIAQKCVLYSYKWIVNARMHQPNQTKYISNNFFYTANPSK